jgi:hypothetical protein
MATMLHDTFLKRPLALLLCLLACGCASLHESVAALPWNDHWGDRGKQVMARDYAMCETLVEQRRALMASCMAARGWSS